MHLLASEYPTTFGGRIDTLAVDITGAPVIIEYKLSKNENVINQALSYLRWLKAQKVEFFEMLIIKRLGKEIAENIKIDWNNPRVICIAETYNKFDLDTVEVIPMRIELMKYRYYENGIFSLESLNTTESNNEQVETTEELIQNKSYNLNDHLGKTQISEVFQELRSRILQLDEHIIEKVTSYYIAYRVSKNFAEIYVGKQQIKIHVRPLNYEDSLHKVETIPESYNWALDRKIYLRNFDELDYIMKLLSNRIMMFYNYLIQKFSMYSCKDSYHLELLIIC